MEIFFLNPDVSSNPVICICGYIYGTLTMTFVCLGSVSEGRGCFSSSEAVGARGGSKGRDGESEELQPHQR